ncbi:hypothetical protein K377_07983 [Streptomyces sp. PsTaAH-137]|nr:hypothetical protein K377_07983 [Streptomyces sp. PsTaAH-137]
MAGVVSLAVLPHGGSSEGRANRYVYCTRIAVM